VAGHDPAEEGLADVRDGDQGGAFVVGAGGAGDEADRPVAGSGQLVVQVAGAAFNPVDVAIPIRGAGYGRCR
jgi:hypothetical protein